MKLGNKMNEWLEATVETLVNEGKNDTEILDYVKENASKVAGEEAQKGKLVGLAIGAAVTAAAIGATYFIIRRVRKNKAKKAEAAKAEYVVNEDGEVVNND